MQENYNSNMYLNYIILNNIENAIYDKNIAIRDELFDGIVNNLREIRNGDNLSGKTLYLSFPRNLDLTSGIDGQDITFFETNNGFSITHYYHNNIAPESNVKINYNNDIYLYKLDSTIDKVGNPFINRIKIRLPDDFGIVQNLNTNDVLKNYIKIYTYDNVIPAYEKNVWSINDLPYMQKIAKIEQGIDDLGTYFQKPIGWITAKNWLDCGYEYNGIEYYGVGSKSFSYIDVNRWIHNLNLIGDISVTDRTIWNTDISQFNWNEESEVEWL